MNANKIPCEFLMNPKDPKYDEKIRLFQGCPTIAITKKGRIFTAWYSGGTREPHIENYNLLVCSDDGVNWSKPILVIPSSKERLVHALDIQLWISPEGYLYVFWIQNNVSVEPEVRPQCGSYQPLAFVDGYMFDDFNHSQWLAICENPDAEELVFSKPKCIGDGFMRCKPTVLPNGNIMIFNYKQTVDRYAYSISNDNGQTFERYFGPNKIDTWFDEGMAYVKKDGSVRLFVRTAKGEIGEMTSLDNGITWDEPKLTGIPNPDTRFYISRTPSGRILLVNNEDNKIRKNMTAYLSEDDGETWKYKLLIDEREVTSYPDVDFYDGKIHLVYDRGRCEEKEILYVKLTEEDIINKNNVDINIISKP